MRWISLTLVVTALGLAACGTSTNPSGTDAGGGTGGTTGTGTGTDAGIGGDAGFLTDGGFAFDAGLGADAGEDGGTVDAGDPPSP